MSIQLCSSDIALQDPDIRTLLQELGSSDNRPRYYTVTPKVSEPEKRLWESKRISPIESTFEDFLKTLDTQIPSAFRAAVATPIALDLPIANKFIVRNPGLSTQTLDFLYQDVDYIYNGMPNPDIDPRLFYRGYSPHWAAIERDLDARREVESQILLDAVLDDDSQTTCRFFCIKGHAGSGKSVLLRRLAWETAISYNQIALMLRRHSTIEFSPLEELSKITSGRLYVFIDDIDEQAESVVDLMRIARRSEIALTIIAASRINEWNISCSDLDPYLSGEFTLEYLTEPEIDDLLQLLERHRALHRLARETPEVRRAAFVERAGRQLLVALHEATLGKRFEDIVADEFEAIQPESAKSIYRGICFLNRLGVPVRAGLINRVYGVRFTDFKAKFFSPLEGLVFSDYDPKSRDYVYSARHPHVADIVTARCLIDADDKYNMYISMINGMNIDYLSDDRSFRRLIRGRSIGADFSEHSKVQDIYFAASAVAGDDPYLLHQRGIYEMNRSGGDLAEALEFLTAAQNRTPWDRSIIHSLAELHLAMAEATSDTLLFQRHVNQAYDLAIPLTDASALTAYGHHTVIKIGIARLKRLLSETTDQDDTPQFDELVREVEKSIQRGLQRFPDEPYLKMAESQLGQILQDDVRAMRTLESAFRSNVHVPLIAMRLAKLYIQLGRHDDARSVYERALQASAYDRILNFQYARFLIDFESDRTSDIVYHLGKSFGPGDGNTEARFWHARQLVYQW